MSITDHGKCQERSAAKLASEKFLKSAMSDEGRLCGWCGSVKTKKNTSHCTGGTAN